MILSVLKLTPMQLKLRVSKNLLKVIRSQILGTITKALVLTVPDNIDATTLWTTLNSTATCNNIQVKIQHSCGH